MALSQITNCPSTLAKGYKTYSITALRHMFYSKKVSAILPYASPKSSESADALFTENRKITIGKFYSTMKYFLRLLKIKISPKLNI